MKKVLVANRGEIALRIIRACIELDLKTVAVYSQADESICIGAPHPSESYLEPRRIISAAIITNSDAIHPGYGFLAENADFAEMCEEHNIIFIGPTALQIRAMGDKSEAKRLMKEAGVPVIPGSEGLVEELENAKEISKQIGYPVIIKATAGGGGKGMRIANNEMELIRYFEMARTEAKATSSDRDISRFNFWATGMAMLFFSGNAIARFSVDIKNFWRNHLRLSWTMNCA